MFYFEYLKEKENFDVVQIPQGFATYKIIGEECYLRDIYVAPEFRHSNKAKELSEKVRAEAMKAGCKFLTGSVCLASNNPTRSMKAILGDGFEVVTYKDNLIWFMKKL